MLSVFHGTKSNVLFDASFVSIIFVRDYGSLELKRKVFEVFVLTFHENFRFSQK
jgi:hypothetical protein